MQHVSSASTFEERLNSSNLHTNKSRGSGIKYISTRYIHQIVHSNCPGQRNNRLYESIGTCLLKNNMVKNMIVTEFQNNINSMVDNMLTIMIKARKGSIEKRII